MADSKQTIKKEIKEYVLKSGQGRYGWYIGIAENARERLFNDHKVNEKNDFWIFRLAESSTIAREIEEELIKELNTKGDSGGGSNLTKYVYAYQITSLTKE